MELFRLSLLNRVFYTRIVEGAARSFRIKNSVSFSRTRSSSRSYKNTRLATQRDTIASGRLRSLCDAVFAFTMQLVNASVYRGIIYMYIGNHPCDGVKGDNSKHSVPFRATTTKRYGRIQVCLEEDSFASSLFVPPCSDARGR